MKSIAVFCGSSSGFEESYMSATREAGRIIASGKYNVVYGGACVGLMGAVADGALEAGGRVIGVLPSFLQTKEITHTGLTELIIVETMHERKLKMHELSDAIIALPGGFGTMEELFEMLTWAQLGLHGKPIGLLNTNNYYEHLHLFVQGMTTAGFLSQNDAGRLIIENDIAILLQKMNEYIAPAAPKWINTTART